MVIKADLLGLGSEFAVLTFKMVKIKRPDVARGRLPPSESHHLLIYTLSVPGARGAHSNYESQSGVICTQPIAVLSHCLLPKACCHAVPCCDVPAV